MTAEDLALPTCPREDCTATCDHTHVLTTGNPYPCFLQVGGSCTGHESDRNYNYTHCYAPRTPQPQPYRFPDGWERGHEAKYWLTTGLTPYGLTLDPEPGVLNWLGVNYYTPDSPHLPKPAAVVLPTVDEVAHLAFMEYWLGVRGAASPLSAQPSAIRASWARAAQAVLDLIAGRITPWQPIEPGTVIKAGTVTRIEWGDRDAREAVTRADYTPCQTDPARYYLDPRTVPTEPEPLVALVLQWAQDCGEAGELTRDEARDLLARIDAARGAL